MLKAGELFNFPEALPFNNIFDPKLAPWEWVSLVSSACGLVESDRFIREIPPSLHIDGDVFIHSSVKLPSYGSITGPAYIGKDTVLRPGVLIRGNVITGKECTLGNACEFKNCLLLDQVQVPHFNYVGDSILGNKVHLGAGVICSNLRLDQLNVSVQMPDGSVCDSRLNKLGALVGDAAEVGCNAVLNPGSILGKRSMVMPAIAFQGHLKANTIAFVQKKITTISRLD